MQVAALPDVVETPRLMLRCWREDDAPALHAAITASVEHLRPWMPWITQEPLEVDDRRRLIAMWTTERADGGDTVYGVFLDGVAIGGSGLHRRLGPHGLEIGYWIHVDHTRRGYATELTASLTDTAFARPGVDIVQICHDKANVASGLVPARLGFTLVAETDDEITSPGEVGINCAWQITREAWTQ